MASGNKREGNGGIDFGADFSGLHERPILKGADLDLTTSMEIVTPAEEPVSQAEERTATPENAAEAETDPLTRLVTAAEKERGLPYTFRIPISMDREFRALAICELFANVGFSSCHPRGTWRKPARSKSRRRGRQDIEKAHIHSGGAG